MIRILSLILAVIGEVVLLLFKSVHLGARFGRWLLSARVLMVLITGGFIFSSVYFYIAFNGPRMKTQPHILPFQTTLPYPPDSAVTLETTPLWPIEDTMISTQPESLRIKSGKIYYEYYCVFCHGTPGQGIGPVGHSFVPTPRDLSTTGVLSLTDSALIRIIVNSPSHNPLLPYVISPEHRKAIATYVRNIGRLREM